MSLVSSNSRLQRRKLVSTVFHTVCAASTFAAVGVVGVLLYDVIRDGSTWLDLQFVTSFPSRFPELAGVKSALFGTLWLIILTALFAVPTGYWRQFTWKYAPPGRLTRLIELNIANLAGVPSIVYILGLRLCQGLFPRSKFARRRTNHGFADPASDYCCRQRSFARSTAVEREAAYGVGASRWQVVRSHVLPQAARALQRA